MNTVTCKGQWIHHFWGTYHGEVALVFPDFKSAVDALRGPLMPYFEPANLRNGESRGARWMGSGDEVEAVKALLTTYGAPKDVDNCTHSIDVGARFELTIPVTPHEQKELF